MKSSSHEDLRAEYLRVFDAAEPDLRRHLVQVVRALCGYVDEPLKPRDAAERGGVTAFRGPRRRSPR